MEEPERFDADPDPTFQANTDPKPDPKNCTLGRKKNLIIIILQELSCVIFSVTMREEGLGVRDKV